MDYWPQLEMQLSRDLVWKAGVTAKEEPSNSAVLLKHFKQKQKDLAQQYHTQASQINLII